MLYKLCVYIICIYIYEWRTELLTTSNGRGQSGWSSIGCEGLRTILNIQVHSLLLYSYANFVGCSYI